LYCRLSKQRRRFLKSSSFNTRKRQVLYVSKFE